MLERDKANLIQGAYFFVDRDFDDLRGRELGQVTFMTDRYSVESYLVTPDVLEELLKDEFRCSTEIEVRETVIEAFKARFAQFLECVREINFRIFLGRRLGLKFANNFPNRINQLAVVALEQVASLQTSVRDLIPLQREPTDEECVAHKARLRFA